MEPTTSRATLFTTKRATTFLVSLIVALSCGTNYIYSAYGPQLGRRLRLSYSEQNFVGLSGNFGGYVSGPPLGKLADSRGPRLCLALAFLLLLSGYLGIKAVFDGSEDDTRPVGNGTLFTLVLSEFLTGVGSNAGFSAALNTVLRSFPDKILTTVSGLIVSGFGLSAFLFSAIAHTLFPGNTSNFLLTLAVGTAAPMVLGWFLVRPCPYPEHTTQTTFESNGQEGSVDPSFVPDESSPLITKDQDQTRPPSVTGLVMMSKIDFWILFWIASFLSGTGVMWINNVGLVVRALALENDPSVGEEETAIWQTVQVSALSIASCFGRVLIGVTADFAKHKGVRRARFISIVAASFLVSQLVGLYIQNIEHLQYAVLLVGISYGATYGLLPVIAIEWFGMAHVSENAGFLSLSPLVMGNVLSMTFGKVFDARSSPGGRDFRCLQGPRCYSESLYASTFACSCALVLALVAGKRDRRYYG